MLVVLVLVLLLDLELEGGAAVSSIAIEGFLSTNYGWSQSVVVEYLKYQVEHEGSGGKKKCHLLSDQNHHGHPHW